MMKRTILAAGLVLVTVLTLGSCATTKKQSQENEVVKDETIWSPQEILKHTFKYKTFQGKADVNFKDKNIDQNLVFNLRIKHQEAIWGSAIAMGIAEVARIYLTPEELQGLSRLNKTAYHLPFSNVNDLLGASITFEQMEHLLLGNPLMNTGEVTNVQQNQEVTSFDLIEGNFTQRIYFHQPSKQIQKITIANNVDGFKAQIDLSEYETLGLNQYFAKYKVIKVEMNGHQYQLSMRFRNQEVDLPVEMSFQVPNSYQVQSILKI